MIQLDFKLLSKPPLNYSKINEAINETSITDEQIAAKTSRPLAPANESPQNFTDMI